jgi:hypothetical protein
MSGEMNQPKNCVLWRDPESVVSVPLQQGFELLETFVEESHWWRYLLKCRECGQLYVFEFLEEVDWVDSDDPQFCTWIPIETDEEVERLKAAAQLDLRMFKPHLCDDRPKGGERKVYWERGEG